MPDLAALITASSDWLLDSERFHGEWQGAHHGAGISIICNRIDGPGGGPRLHKHPYREIFIVRSGTGIFTIGTAMIEAGPGQILVAPPGTPHKFENKGPEPLETIDIHESSRFVTEWLED